MKLKDVMNSPVQTIAPEADARAAREHMKRERLHHLLVKKGREVLGVVSSTDLAAAAPDATVESLMSGHVVVAGPDTTIRKAANILRGRTIGCLPIVERGRPIGIVTMTDLLELLGRGAERPTARGTRWTLRKRGPRKVRPSEDRSRLTYYR